MSKQVHEPKSNPGSRSVLRWSAVVLVGLVLAAGIIDAVTWRGDYRAIELSATDLRPDRDPAELALRVAGYPDGDGLMAEEVDESCEPDSCVVIVTDERLGGDSLEARQVRVEVGRTPDGWVANWAGVRWRCAPGRGIPLWGGWTTLRCV